MNGTGLGKECSRGGARNAKPVSGGTGRVWVRWEKQERGETGVAGEK